MNKCTGSIHFLPHQGLTTLANENSSSSESTKTALFRINVATGELLTNVDQWFHMTFSESNESESFGKISMLGKFVASGDESHPYKFVLKALDEGPEEEVYAKRNRLRSKLESLTAIKDEDANRRSSATVTIVWHSEEEECQRYHSDARRNFEKCSDMSKAIPSGTIYIIHNFALTNFLSETGTGTAGGVRNVDNSLVNKVCKLYESITVANSEFADVSAREDEIMIDGEDFSVFRKTLKRKGWFGRHTYLYKESDNEKKFDSYRRKFFIRLSRAGVVEVREEFELDGERDFSVVLNELIEYRPARFRFTHRENDRLSRLVKRFVCEIIARFAAAAIPTLKTDEMKILKNAAEILQDELKDDSSNAKEVDFRRRRQIYIAVVLSNVSCKDCKKRISPKELHKNISLVQSLVEGTLIIDERNFATSVPALPDRIKKEIKDKSTWINELCVLGTERCFIYFVPRTVLEGGGKVANYETYWKCVVRGIEHTLSVRTSLQLLEAATEKDMSMVPELVKDFGAENYDDRSHHKTNSEAELSKKKLEKRVNKLTENVANTLLYLPSLREICVPSSAFRSVHVIDKFAYLNEKCFRFSSVLNHLQQNVDELVEMLIFFKQQQLRMQIEETRKDEKEGEEKDRNAQMEIENREKLRDRKIAILALIFTMGSILYVSTSFIGDFNQINEKLCLSGPNCSLNPALTFAVISYGAILFFLWLTYMILIHFSQYDFSKRLDEMIFGAEKQGTKKRRYSLLRSLDGIVINRKIKRGRRSRSRADLPPKQPKSPMDS